MSLFKIPVFQSNSKKLVYFCDSNFCLELVRFFYNGKCLSIDANEFIEFLIESSHTSEDFFFDFALKELSFDYSSNSINKTVLNHFDTAVNGVLSMTDREILSHSCADKEWVPDRDQSCAVRSIFECRFPNAIAGEMADTGIDRLFYATYLARIKLQELYTNRKIDPIEKIEGFFDYFANKINLVPGVELQLAQMLFVGDSIAERTAKKLLKVDNQQSIKIINNTVEDIFLFRLCQKFASLTQRMIPCSVYFLTSDKALADLFAVSKIVASSNFAADIITTDSGIRPRLLEGWNQLYKTKILPTMRNRFPSSIQQYDCDLDLIKQEIQILEKTVLSEEIITDR